VARNDTEYSYRISMTWIDVPLNSDAEYICYAARKEDGMEDATVERVNVKCKYSTVNVVIKFMFVVNTTL
jgi:hypothetical protein